VLIFLRYHFAYIGAMDLSDLDVVETSDVEELEEPERSRDFPRFQVDYCYGTAGESDRSFPPRKRIKVRNLLYFYFRHIFSVPAVPRASCFQRH
jgi:hypothetical protein